MASDDALAERVRRALGSRRGVTEKRMFGGLAFFLHGKMFCGIVGGELMVRVGPARYAEALARAHARPMDFTGRPMTGYVYVASAGCGTLPRVRTWVSRGFDFVSTLDAK